MGSFTWGFRGAAAGFPSIWQTTGEPMGNIEKIERLTTQVKNLKLAGAKAARVGSLSVLTTAGGGFAGFVDAKISKIPNTNLDTAGIAGAVGVVLAVSDVFDNYSENVAAMAAGMLAYVGGRETKEFFLTR